MSFNNYTPRDIHDLDFSSLYETKEEIYESDSLNAGVDEHLKVIESFDDMQRREELDLKMYEQSPSLIITPSKNNHINTTIKTYSSYNLNELIPSNSRCLSIIKNLMFDDESKMKAFLESSVRSSVLFDCSITRILDLCSHSISHEFKINVINSIKNEKSLNLYWCGFIDNELAKITSDQQSSLKNLQMELKGVLDRLSPISHNLDSCSERMPGLFATIPKIAEELIDLSKKQRVLTSELKILIDESKTSKYSKLVFNRADSETSSLCTIKTKYGNDKSTLSDQKQRHTDSYIINSILGIEEFKITDYEDLLTEINQHSNFPNKQVLPSKILLKMIGSNKGVMGILLYHLTSMSLKECILLSSDLNTENNISLFCSLISKLSDKN